MLRSQLVATSLLKCPQKCRDLEGAITALGEGQRVSLRRASDSMLMTLM